MYATAAGKVGTLYLSGREGATWEAGQGLSGPQAARIDSDGGFGRFKLAGCRASLDRDWPPVAVDRFTSPIDWNGARVASLPYLRSTSPGALLALGGSLYPFRVASTP